jgi:hypothetical protein
MATMNIQMLPQLCVHLIGSFIEDEIEKQKEQMVKEYISTRAEAMSYEVIDWIKSEKLKKKELGMLKEATTYHKIISIMGGAQRVKDWQPDGWRYKRAKAIEMEAEILRSIDNNLYTILNLKDNRRSFAIYMLARTYELYGVMEYLTAKQQGKKKAIKK